MNHGRNEDQELLLHPMKGLWGILSLGMGNKERLKTGLDVGLYLGVPGRQKCTF